MVISGPATSSSGFGKTIRREVARATDDGVSPRTRGVVQTPESRVVVDNDIRSHWPHLAGILCMESIHDEGNAGRDEVLGPPPSSFPNRTKTSDDETVQHLLLPPRSDMST